MRIFIKGIVDAVFSVFDGALDFVVNVILAAIFDAVPELKEFFRALDFAELETFVKGPLGELRKGLLDMVQMIQDELSLNALDAGNEVNAYWQANILSGAHTQRTSTIHSTAEDIFVDFACAADYFPIVGMTFECF